MNRAYGYMHDTDELNNIPTTAENSLSLGQGNIHIQGVPSKATNSAINIQSGASGIQIKPGSSNMSMGSSYGSMQINGGNSVATNMQINATKILMPPCSLAMQILQMLCSLAMLLLMVCSLAMVLQLHIAALMQVQCLLKVSAISQATNLLRPAKHSAIHERLTAQAAARAEAEAKAKAFAEFMGKNSEQSTDLNTYASNGSHSVDPSHARAIEDQSSSAADRMMDSGANYGVPAMRGTIRSSYPSSNCYVLKWHSIST